MLKFVLDHNDYKYISQRAVPTNNDKICEAGMTQRLELHQVEQLSACRISLLLGLNAEQNYIEQFFRFSVRLLKCQKADPRQYRGQQIPLNS